MRSEDSAKREEASFNTTTKIKAIKLNTISKNIFNLTNRKFYFMSANQVFYIKLISLIKKSYNLPHQ